ncbi:hypothetical protein V8G54_021582, partial [Vigna mungo]
NTCVTPEPFLSLAITAAEKTEGLYRYFDYTFECFYGSQIFPINVKGSAGSLVTLVGSFILTLSIPCEDTYSTLNRENQNEPKKKRYQEILLVCSLVNIPISETYMAMAVGAVAAPLGSSVISLVNWLMDILSRVGSHSSIHLPQVAVVGSQSSGKSSVLEALIGRDFLPCGNDICTRRPLVLQLVHIKPSQDEFGEFLHLPGPKFHDFSQIRSEIQVETDRESRGNKVVFDKKIR